MEDVKCPRCGSKKVMERKSWKLTGGRGKIDFRVHLYHCIRCDKIFRKMERI